VIVGIDTLPVIPALTKNLSMPESPWCVRYHRGRNKHKPEQQSRNVWNEQYRQQQYQFDRDKHACDFPPEARVVPQFDPVKSKPGKQHKYDSAYEGCAVTEDRHTRQHDSGQVQGPQRDA